MKKVKTLKRLKTVFLTICIVILLFYISFFKKPLVTNFPIQFFIITSGSMSPYINTGEMVITLKKSNYKVNDVITFLENESYFVTHRIIRKEENGFVTKGDFNNIEDKSLVQNSQIKGKVIFHSKILAIVFKYRIIINFMLIIILIMHKKEVK